MVPRLSTYYLGTISDDHLRFFEPQHGPRFAGSGRSYAEYVDETDWLRGFTIWESGVQPSSLLPIPPGCGAGEESSATALILNAGVKIRPIPRAAFVELWEANVLTSARFFRGRVRSDFRWRLADGGIEAGPGWAYQAVQGRWITEEFFVRDGDGDGRVSPETPTQMHGFLDYDEIEATAFLAAR